MLVVAAPVALAPPPPHALAPHAPAAHSLPRLHSVLLELTNVPWLPIGSLWKRPSGSSWCVQYSFGGGSGILILEGRQASWQAG